MEFGKLNFSVAFNPTSAFPLDARSYFEGETALEDAIAVASSAEDVGSTNTAYHYGQKLLVNVGGVYKWYEIGADKTLKETGIYMRSSGGYIQFSTNNADWENVIAVSALKGDKGDKGDPGEKGADGADGKDGVNGTNGADGKDGTNGKDGLDGKDGKTPEKGVDYFTEEDKTELVASVLNALPTWEGGSY